MLRTGVIATALLVLAATPAHAAKHYAGKTAQNKLIRVHTTDDDVLTQVKLRWKARCNTGLAWHSVTSFNPPFKLAPADALRDFGDYREPLQGFDGNVHITIAGLHVDENTWKGTFRVRVVAKRNGKYFTTCKAGPIPWTVRGT